jgi:hypothetical protein
MISSNTPDGEPWPPSDPSVAAVIERFGRPTAFVRVRVPCRALP